MTIVRGVFEISYLPQLRILFGTFILIQTQFLTEPKCVLPGKERREKVHVLAVVILARNPTIITSKSGPPRRPLLCFILLKDRDPT